MIAPDQHAVAEEPKVAVGMAGKLENLPAADLTALVEQVGIDRVADERRERVSLDDEVLGDIGGHAVSHEPRRHSLRPVVATPDPLALSVVEPALEDRGGGGLGRRLCPTDVVRMEVGDRDALGVHGVPRRVSEPETGVEERAVREVAVDVLGPGR